MWINIFLGGGFYLNYYIWFFERILDKIFLLNKKYFVLYVDF